MGEYGIIKSSDDCPPGEYIACVFSNPSELVQLKLNIGTSVGKSTPPKQSMELPLIEVAVCWK